MAEIEVIVSDDRLLAEVARAAFDSVDGSGALGSGRLARAMEAVANELGVSAPGGSDLSEVMKELDLDKDKTVSLEALEAFIKQVLEVRMAQAR